MPQSDIEWFFKTYFSVLRAYNWLPSEGTLLSFPLATRRVWEREGHGALLKKPEMAAWSAQAHNQRNGHYSTSFEFSLESKTILTEEWNFRKTAGHLDVLSFLFVKFCITTIVAVRRSLWLPWRKFLRSFCRLFLSHCLFPTLPSLLFHDKL